MINILHVPNKVHYIGLHVNYIALAIDSLGGVPIGLLLIGDLQSAFDKEVSALRSLLQGEAKTLRSNMDEMNNSMLQACLHSRSQGAKKGISSKGNGIDIYPA